MDLRGCISQDNHAHKRRLAGKRSKERKKITTKKEKAKGNLYNPRAFSVANIVRTQRILQRNLDISQKKEYVQIADRRTAEIQGTPPILVVVVGPPSVGKSTLIRSLVKLYTDHNLATTTGPITVATRMNTRITLLECANDAGAMLDCAKIADLVLLCVDANFGFEMETFEFLNILQTHGFPKITAVFTHLDQFRTAKNLRNTKKLLKNRFWTEIYGGAKVFYFSGVVNGKYLKNEVKQLALFMSRAKFRPLLWRSTHPFVLVDRHEDVTRPDLIDEKPERERSVMFYGYARGSHIKPGMLVHAVGVGDFCMEEVVTLMDPCPLPDKERERMTVNQKRSRLFAPSSSVGAVSFDADAVYIDVGRESLVVEDRTVRRVEERMDERDEGAALLQSLQDVEAGVDGKIDSCTMRIFRGSDAVRTDLEMSSGDSDGGGIVGDEKDDDEEQQRTAGNAAPGSSIALRMEGARQDKKFSQSDRAIASGAGSHSGCSDDDAEVGREERSSVVAITNWKAGIPVRSVRLFLDRQSSSVDLQELIYRPGKTLVERDVFEGEETANQSDSDDDFLTPREPSSDKPKKAYPVPVPSLTEDDSSRATLGKDGTLALFDIVPWLQEGDDCALESIRNRVVTGDWNSSDCKGQDEDFSDLQDLGGGCLPPPRQFELSDEASSDEEGCVSGVKLDWKSMPSVGARALNAPQKRKQRVGVDVKAKETVAGREGQDEKSDCLGALKCETGCWMQRDKQVFNQDRERSHRRREGLHQGLYCRIKIDGVPANFLRSFKPHMPLIIGGLRTQETNLGLVRCRFKKHRWHEKILKCNDPLIFSMGWRRFQSIPVYSTEDRSGRHRHLKYTPEHTHCFATFYGPQVPPNTGVLAIQSLSGKLPGYRISGTGTVLELDSSFPIVKRLRLVGSPTKVHKRSASISGMFNSDVEVNRFEGASIRTVSGVRGQVKKALREGQPGSFRATFEDKILLSDLVFCRTWIPVEVKRYFNPITSHLDGVGALGWRSLKRKAELQIERGTSIEVNVDSIYDPIDRTEKKLLGVYVPKRLEEALPFANKAKNQEIGNGRKSYATKRTLVAESEERKKVAFMSALETIRNENLFQRNKRKRRCDFEKATRKVPKEVAALCQRRAKKKCHYRAEGKHEKG